MTDYNFGDQQIPQGPPAPQAAQQSYDFGDQQIQQTQPTQDPKINDALKAHFDNTIGTAGKAAVDADGNLKPFSLTDAWEAGWQQSVTGLQHRQALPSKVLPNDASFMQHMANDAAGLIGDAPYIAEGAGIGLAGGIEGGPVGMIAGSGGGAMALPAAMRSILIDGYKNGDFKTPEDFVSRASVMMLDTAKSWVTGAATALTGGGTAALTEGASPLVRGMASSAASTFTMTELSKRLNGLVPSWSDFVENGALFFGLHSAGMGVDKFADIYKKTGVQPQDVAKDAQADPVTQTELVSNQAIPTKYMAAAEQEAQAKESTMPTSMSAGTEVGPALPPEPTGPGEGLSDEEKAAFAKVGESIGLEQPEKINPRASFNSVYKDWVDAVDPVKRYQEDFANGTDIKPSENPYMLLRLLKGGFGRADQFVSHATIDYNTYKPNGDSLADVLAPLKDGDGTLDGLRQAMVAIRSVELEKRGIKTGVDQDAANIVGHSDAAYKRYGKMAEGVTDYSNRVTEYAKNAGLIDNKTFGLFKELNKYYVPFNRIFENPEEMEGQVGKSSPFNAIEGSDKKIFDPIASVIKNTYQTTMLSERNAAKVNMIKMARAAGHVGEGKLFEPVNPLQENQPKPDIDGAMKMLQSNALALTDDDVFNRIETMFKSRRQAVAPDHVVIYENGIRKVYNVGDKDLATALQGSTPEAHGLFFKLHAAVNKWGRSGAILDPAFLPKHMFRQNINAGVYSENDLIPFVAMAKGAATLMGDPDGETLTAWRMSGAMNAEFSSMDRRYVTNKINEIENGGSILDKTVEQVKDQAIAKIQSDPLYLGKLPYNAMLKGMDYEHALIAFHDNSLRVEEVKASLQKYQDAGMDYKDAVLKAGFDGRELLTDYARMGAKMGAVNQLSMFANMRVQGFDKMVRSIGDNPGRTLAKLSLLVAVPTILNWWANHKDPRYAQQEDWQRDTNWVIPTDDWRQPRAGDILPVDLKGQDVPWLTRMNDGQKEYNFGATLRVPKPMESGQMFGSLLEHYFDFASGQKTDSWSKLGANILGDMVPDYLPTLERPVIEQWANKSRFTNGPIVPGAAENRLPAQQYTPYTTELSKAMANILGTLPGVDTTGTGNTLSIASPAIVENYVRGWGSSLGMTLLHLADQGLRNAGVLPNPTQPTPTLADNVFIKGFVARYPTATTQNIENFNEQFKVAFRTYNSMQFLAKSGNMVAAQQLMKTEPFMQTVVQDKQAMDKAQNYITRVTSDPKMPPNDKRQLIESGYYQLIMMANQANTQLKLMAAAANKGPEAK